MNGILVLCPFTFNGQKGRRIFDTHHETIANINVEIKASNHRTRGEIFIILNTLCFFISRPENKICIWFLGKQTEINPTHFSSIFFPAKQHMINQ
jgi:hypothetical protein